MEAEEAGLGSGSVLPQAERAWATVSGVGLLEQQGKVETSLGAAATPPFLSFAPTFTTC